MEQLFIVRHARLEGETDEKGDCFENIGFWQASSVIDVSIAICGLITDKQPRKITIHDVPNTPSEESLRKQHADIKRFVAYWSLGQLQFCDGTKIFSTSDIAAKETAMFLATALTQRNFTTASCLDKPEDACELFFKSKEEYKNVILVTHHPFIRKFISLFLGKLGHNCSLSALPEINNAEALFLNLKKNPPEIKRIKS